MTEKKGETRGAKKSPEKGHVSREQAEEAVRVLLRWVGEEPEREGLFDTPRRFVDALQEHCEGLHKDPEAVLSRTFQDVDGYEDMVLLRDVHFVSHCEHHIAPILGRAHVAYLPYKRVVGISKLARVVDIYSRRLQVQERMTAQIARVIDKALKPRGVAVVIEAVHHCMTTRGVHKPDVAMVTSHLTGAFRDDSSTRAEFLDLIGRSLLGTPYKS
ncbi:MAG: GTP cyclohydrolase I FolE [Alphaproteobacteria bacterium GM202ARS2]|nr:GTP cyclohydrolase I FolE [Alphaproteobacteria bacterium GM202ARS2]